MSFKYIYISEKLVPSNYLKLAVESQKSKEIQVKELLEKRSLPLEGWSDDLIEYVVQQLSQLDSNNFPHNAGLGEREARVICKLVARRHYNFGHGIGRSGDLLEAQPKAVGSTILSQLTNAMLLDLIRAMGIQNCQSCFLIPIATGMTLTLCFLSLRKQRPQAKYILWSRIDQKSCFKSITTAGFTPIIINTIRISGKEGLFTDLEEFEKKIETIRVDEILCIMSTTSCFAPRNMDDIQKLAIMSEKYQIPHVINNAYGLQSSYICSHIQQASRAGRVDLFVQSTDKNFMVPVGGAIVAGFNKEIVHNVAKTYAGRASSSQTLDIFMTLLSLGKNGYLKLSQERKQSFEYLKSQLEDFANSNNCSLKYSKLNPISMAVYLDSITDEQPTKLGSMLYTRGISGTRVVAKCSNKHIDDYEFRNWGSHGDIDGLTYLTAASSLGLTKSEIDVFIKKLKECWKDLKKLITMTTEAEFHNSYECIKQANKLTLKQIDRAIELEEQEKPLEAIEAYEESLNLIETVFSIPVGLPDKTNGIESEWSDACTIIQKLKGAKTEVTHRLKVLRQQYAPIDCEAKEAQENDDDDLSEPQAKKKSSLLENPNTFYDIQNVAGGPRKTYKQIAKGLREMIADNTVPVFYDTLFQAQVKLYKILPNGVVQKIAGETSMSLVMCTVGGKWSYLNGIYFIQCSMKGQITEQPSTSQAEEMIWIYALVPTVTSCYRTSYGAFIFPDLESEVAGSAFGIMLTAPSELSEEQFADLQQFFLDLLEAVLAGQIDELPQPFATRPTRDTSQQVSRHIVTAADFIAKGLVRGAEKTGELMMKSTPYIISKMNPAPENPPPVSQGIQTTVEVAKGVTTAAVGVTGWVAGKVGSASVAIGRFLAPHIQHHGANLLQKTCGYDQQEAHNKMEGALTLAAGAVEGFSTIVDGLEKSAAILGNNLSENSVKIIEHKYGSPAGYVAADTFDTLGNAFIVSRNVNYMLPKGIAKKMVKNTGIAVVDEYKRNYKGQHQYVTAGALYPDLRALHDKTEEAYEGIKEK